MSELRVYGISLLIVLVGAILVIIIVSSKRNTERQTFPTLQSVHVVFRHGDKTPEPPIIYPLDPHKNQSYYPYGYGELTKKGKQRMYQLGRALRKKYGTFLGNLYTPSLVEALTSQTSRSEMSLQLVLAGLFPPDIENAIDPNLNWQPVTFDIVPKFEDKYFKSFSVCPSFQKLFTEHIRSIASTPERQQIIEIFRYITNHTGYKMQRDVELFYLQNLFVSEKEWGLKLPQWTQNIYPEPLKTMVRKSFELMSATTALRRITAGFLLKKIIDNTEHSQKDTKLYLYSGHQQNIIFMLIIFDAFDSKDVLYGDSLVLEVHKIDNLYGFKIFYQDYCILNVEALQLPECEVFCPMDKFKLLMEKYLPRTNTCEGDQLL